MVETGQTKMKPRRKILIVAAILIGVAIVIPVVHHFQLRAAENGFRATLKAKGVLPELSQALPPSPSQEQDGTQIFLRAAAWLEADKTFLNTDSIYAMRPIAAGKAMVASQQPVVHLDETTNSWQALAAAIHQNQTALDWLRQIIGRPALDFHIQYAGGTADLNFTNMNLVQLKKSARYLSEEAICDLHAGDTASAVTNNRAMLALAEATGSQRLMISELVRMAMVNMAQSLSFEILQSPGVTDNQLAILQNDWSHVNFLKNYQDALAMEQVCEEITDTKWRNSDAELEKYFDLLEKARKNFGWDDEDTSMLTRFENTFNAFRWRYWWSYSDGLRSLRCYEVIMTKTRQAGADGIFLKAYQQQQRQLDALGITNGLENFFASIFTGKKEDLRSMSSDSIGILASAFHKVMLYETADRVVVTAIALKRFQLKHGEYPEKLSQLVPELLVSPPLDAVDGQLLRYRRNANGTFTLYSIGENGVDDGGDPSLEKNVTSSSYYWQNVHSLDWVWPQPATAAEVQYYYEHPPK